MSSDVDSEPDIKISTKDMVLFIQMLEKPSPPNSALVEAFDRYKARLKESTEGGKNVDELMP